MLGVKLVKVTGLKSYSFYNVKMRERCGILGNPEILHNQLV